MTTSTEDAKTATPLLRSQQQDLASAMARLTTTLQSAGDGVIVTDLEGRIEFLNLAAERLMGIESVSAEGRPLQEILRLEERFGDTVKNNLVDLAIIGDAPIALGKDLVLSTHTGLTRQVEGEISVRIGGGVPTGTVITIRDVTARQWDELQRREEQKFSAVGRLAGAVAHELNNLLTVILGHSEVLHELYRDLPPVQASTAAIQQAATGIGVVARQLLALGHREVLQPKTLNLNTLVEGASLRLRELIPAEVELAISLEPDLGNILVDPSQMELALFNLVCHCLDRMPAGGRIELRTANVTVDANARARHLRRYVQLSIEDSGSGFNGHATEEVFEPSWSKEPSRPYGLGLFTARNVVSAANGHLSIESESEVGAKFVLLFPQVEEEIVLPEDRTVAARQKGQATLLLVEDDNAIRILLRNSFEKRGYRVLEARDGEEALFQAELHQEGIDLLISDVGMPNMDGPTLARQLVIGRPDIRVLLISGGPVEPGGVQDLIRRGAHFVQKPFSQQELLAQVEALLKD